VYECGLFAGKRCPQVAGAEPMTPKSTPKKQKTLGKRVSSILERLRAAYPGVKTQLRHGNPFELLVATILSAQCTDKQVNAVTEDLFRQLPDPPSFANASLETIETLIHSTGFYRNKAKHIRACARQILEEHGGTVPSTLEALVRLPGVGRKTANVVLGAAFDTPGVVVDTHVGRISRRLGLTAEKDPVKVEFDLMAIVPRSEWSDFSLRLVYFGRDVCTARRPKCPRCFLKELCPWPEKTATQ
jgi:endonuclease-3